MFFNFFEGTIASTMADKYIITLKHADKSEILEQATLKSITYAYDFGGIEINTEYEVSLVCVFGKRQFSCGSSSLYSGGPLLVQEADYSAKVFVQSSIPRSWHEMEYQCRSSGGHLVSFDTQVSLISNGRSVLFR